MVESCNDDGNGVKELQRSVASRSEAMMRGLGKVALDDISLVFPTILMQCTPGPSGRGR